MKEGNVIASQSKNDIEKKSLRLIKVRFSKLPEIKDLEKNKFIKNFSINNNQISFMISGEMDDFVKFISNYKVLDIETESSNLSDTLMEYF